MILFGEHAVAYGKLGIAAAIGESTIVELVKSGAGIRVSQPFNPIYSSISKDELFKKLERFNQLYEAKDLVEIKKMSFLDSMHIVIAETMRRFGFEGMTISLQFDNKMKGIGRSASIYSGIATAISAQLNANASKNVISEIAYLGDVIAHAGTPSGIDTSTVTFGGYISYKKSDGSQPLSIDYSMPLLIVDSGELSSTKEAVSRVRIMREQNTAKIDGILEQIDGISNEALELLKKKNLEGLGKLASKNQELLRELDISTPKLEEILEIARDNGALGAKITGAGMGGCAIVMSRNATDSERLRNIYLASGYKAISTSLGTEGSRFFE